MRIPKSEDSHCTIKKIMGPHHNHFFLHFFLSFLFPLQLSFVLLPSLTDQLWQFRVGSGLRGILGCSRSQWWFWVVAIQESGEVDDSDAELDFMNLLVVILGGRWGWWRWCGGRFHEFFYGGFPWPARLIKTMWR